MEKILIKDDDENYINVDYLLYFIDFKYSRLFAQIVFTTIKEPYSTKGFANMKTFECYYECCIWIDNFLSIMPNFHNNQGTYENNNLCSFDVSDIPLKKNDKEDFQTLSHINIKFINEEFSHLELILIDSNQALQKKFTSEQHAREWIESNFKIL
ncbi:hypothetical protein [Acinetobacter gyllenbergii]|uniref:hypothetical protein n=1 Tax=Acinetobacter gyllenbergii TaxID=134534 RepID=UPI003F56F67B